MPAPEEDNKAEDTKPAPKGPAPESNMKQMLKELELKSKQIETLQTENNKYKAQISEFSATGAALDEYKTHVGAQVKTMFDAIPETRRKFVTLDEKNPLESMKALNTYQAMMTEIEAEIKKDAGITDDKKVTAPDPNNIKTKPDEKPKPPRSLSSASETRQRFLKIKQAGIEKPETK
jgi:flagellar biosynthesis chaperone FliJ